MKTIKGKLKVWITDSAAQYGYDKDSINGYAYSNAEMSDCGWTLAGTAEITIKIESDDALVKNMVSAIDAQIQKTKADAQVAINALEERKQQLLALPATVQS